MRFKHVLALAAVSAAATTSATAQEPGASTESRVRSLDQVISRYDDAVIGVEVAAAYPKLPTPVQTAAQSLLASRASWSLALLRLIESGTVPLASVAADTVARLRAHADPTVAALALPIPMLIMVMPSPVALGMERSCPTIGAFTRREKTCR